MSGSTGKISPNPGTGKQDISPGGQAYFSFPFMPGAVKVTNDSSSVAGSYVSAWVYPSTANPVMASGDLISEAGQVLMPPVPDGNGNQALALVVFNTGQAALTCENH